MASKAKSTAIKSMVPAARLERLILVIRGEKVILDHELALLYGVTVGRLNEAVKRNRNRFPADFMMKLTAAEHKSLLSQIAIAKPGRGGRRTPPYAFTEQGVAMLSSVLNSDRAVKVNIEIMRAFVRLRQLIASNEQLSRRLSDLERTMVDHDEKFAAVFDAIRELMSEEDEAPGKPRIGYEAESQSK